MGSRPSKDGRGLARTFGTITSPVWFVLVCLSLDETYGRVQELMFFVTPSIYIIIYYHLIDLVSFWIGIICVWRFQFCIFLFFFSHVSGRQISLFMYCSRDPQPLYSEKKNIKNGSHNTIHTFKNYFATVFSIFSFQQNKLYPNGPLESLQIGRAHV